MFVLLMCSASGRIRLNARRLQTLWSELERTLAAVGQSWTGRLRGKYHSEKGRGMSDDEEKECKMEDGRIERSRIVLQTEFL